MKNIYFLLIIFLASTATFSQFKNDNVLYRTVYPQDLCAELQQSKKYLLLDVRSPDEYSDTSSSPLYNYGHLQNAVNIDVSEIGKGIQRYLLTVQAFMFIARLQGMLPWRKWSWIYQ